MAKRSAPEVNAGSMADIAFLLLIFFLVTTTIEVDSGINSKLPPETPPDQDVVIKQKNLFTVEISKDNQLLVEEELMEMKDLKAAALAFVDNGGGIGDKACNYCRGAKDPSSSDNPEKAVISLQNSRGTDYETFITAYDQLASAYSELRNRLAQQLYNRSFDEMEATYKDTKSSEFKSEKLKEKINDIKTKYPRIISKAEPK